MTDVIEGGKKGGLRRAGVVAANIFLPVYAGKKLVETKDSVVRIGRMLRGEKIYQDEMSPEDAARLKELQQEEAQGREIILSLPEHERFEFLYAQMKWGENSLAEQKRYLVRSHAVRLSLFYILCLITPAMIFRSGWWVLFYMVPAAACFFIVCLKSTCFYIQIQERALWSLAQLLQRTPQRWWLVKKALWFLE